MKQKFKYTHYIILVVLITSLLTLYSFVDENASYTLKYISLILLSISVTAFIMYLINRRNLNKMWMLENRQHFWNSISYRVKRAGETAFNELPIAIIVYSKDRNIEWANNYAKEIFLSPLVERKLENINPDLNNKIKILTEFEIDLYGKTFACYVLPENNIVYLIDKTEIRATEVQYQSRMLAIGVLELDNLREALESYDPQERAKQVSNLMSILGEWSDNFDIYLRGYSEERYLLIMDRSQLDSIIEEKFQVIETIRDYCSKEGLRITASLGIACEDIKSNELIEIANEQLALATNRGGNQVVVKVNGETSYFGAKITSAETRNPVYVRVKTEIFVDLIMKSSNVYIMSHADMDADAFGACLAAYKLVEAIKGDVKIIFDPELIDETITNIYNVIKKEYINVLDYFIHSSDALSKMNNDTLVIIVDTQYQNLLMSEKIFKRSKRVAILDHHRRNNYAINDYNFLYTHSSASSTVELIVEMFEYLKGEVTMSSVEATWMLMGIIVDTNNLMYRVSYRTFNVLSVLQKYGAELTKVQRFLRENYSEYLKRMAFLNELELIDGRFGIVLCDDDTYPRAFLAKTADSAINVNNIKAAFCIGKIGDDEIGISARSLDEINVQLIMEQLGGGGHFNNAATQIKDSSIPEVKQMLLNELKKIEEGGQANMKIILMKDVKGKGKIGEIIDIPAGHANFLVRSGQAVLATIDNIKQLEKKQEEERLAEEEHLNEMKELKEVIDNTPVKIIVKVGKEGKLFGSVSSKQIVDEYKLQNNIVIDKRKMLIDEDISALGTYKIPLQLHKQVTATITLFVVEN